MADFAIGHFLCFLSGGNTVYRYQNFFINESITYDSNPYVFVPFGFSGTTVNKTGDGVDSDLVFPNNTISRSWADDALRNSWIAYVRTLIVDPDDKTSFSLLSQYYGAVDAGSWDDTTLKLTLNTVLDAVGNEFPRRRLNQQLCGEIPITASVRLQ